jgi:hypothetical protein
VTIVWKTAEEVSALMLNQEADVCMLPEAGRHGAGHEIPDQQQE